MSAPRPGTRRAARALSLVGAFLALVTLRVVVASRSELAEGDRLRAAGELDAAVVHYRRAARWYAPASPYVSRALDRMAAIGRRAEAEGDADLALVTERAIRAAILSTRSFYTPHRERLDAANRRIATLVAALPAPAVDAGKSEAEIREAHLALLQAPIGPALGGTLLLLVGFFAWVAGAFLLAARGFDEEDRLVRSEAGRWGALVAGGFLLFVVGLALA